MTGQTIPREDYLSTGSTLLNLACSGLPNGGMAKGRYFWIVGDSSSGKTFLTLTALAEASINPNFDVYDLIFDDVEGGALMDIEKYFGKLKGRIQPPAVENDLPLYSRFIEDFYFRLDDRLQAVKQGKKPPFIWLLDSMDALSSKYARSKFEEKKKADRKGTKAAGDYGDGKAKLNSTHIREIVADIRDTKCILIVLSQTRDNIGASMFEPQKTSAGGHALKFYATWQLWSSVGKRLKKTVNGKDRQTGIIARIAIKKNRMTGKEWTVEIPIYHSRGIDDTGACIDFLVEEKHWKGDEKRIIAPEVDFEGSRGKLIKHIEDGDFERTLKAVVTEVWREVEAACQVTRKSRYG